MDGAPRIAGCPPGTQQTEDFGGLWMGTRGDPQGTRDSCQPTLLQRAHGSGALSRSCCVIN